MPRKTRILLRARPLAAFVFSGIAACASTPVDRRATAITDADRDARRAVTSEEQIDVARIPARSIGVLPFTVEAQDTLLLPLGHALAEFLSTDLSRSTALVVVDRLHTDAILRELSLVDKGIVDPRTGPRVGRLIGARRLLIGSVRRGARGTIDISARVVDVLGGTVQTLVAANAPLDRAIDAEKVLALRVFEELGVTLTPAQRIAIEQRQTTNLAATVAYGKGLDAESHGDAAGAAKAYQEAAQRDAAFAGARTQLAGNSSRTAGSQIGGAQRVLALSAQAINTPAGAKLPEAADAALVAKTLTLLITVRIF